MQRPSFLAQVPNLSDRAVQGIGGSLPPHISIRGNQFTLVDGTGNKRTLPPVTLKDQQGQPYAVSALDFLVVDVGDVIGKMFYSKGWENDSDDPPDCWSTNGIGPSRDAITPQARTCAECKNNERGSKISGTGASVKACRDEQYLAIVVPQFPNMLFQLKILPGSFKAWKAHVEQCKQLGKQTGFEESISTILTRAVFESGKNGVLAFSALAYPPDEVGPTVLKARQSKDTDILVGRLDRPRELPAPRSEVVTTGDSIAAIGAGIAEKKAEGGFGQQNAPATTPAQPESQKRHRRTKAEIEADNAAKAAQAPNPQPAMAPFRPDPAPVGNGAAFGIAANPPGPSAEIEASLQAAFGGKPAGGGFGS